VDGAAGRGTVFRPSTSGSSRARAVAAEIGQCSKEMREIAMDLPMRARKTNEVCGSGPGCGRRFACLRSAWPEAWGRPWPLTPVPRPRYKHSLGAGPGPTKPRTWRSSWPPPRPEAVVEVHGLLGLARAGPGARVSARLTSRFSRPPRPPGWHSPSWR
jgi:hypothetical protein